MKLKPYIMSLLPIIGKKDISNDLGNLRKELQDQTIPPYASAGTLFKDWKWKDKDLAKFDKNFVKGVDSKFRGNFINVTSGILSRMLDNISTLEKLVDKQYSNDVIRSAMTYSETQLLQYIETVSFAVKYSRKILMFALAAETALQRQNKMVGKELTPAERNWLISNQANYVRAMRQLDTTSRELEKAISAIPDIEVDVDNIDEVTSTVGLQALDPFSLGVVGAVMNPIYHLRMAIADWQSANYDAAVEERKMVEYRLLDLKNAQAEQSDAKLEKAIAYTQDRIKRLNYKIAKMEEVDD